MSRCGYVAFVGRANVGKSTLLNHIVGQKLAITSRKPQTTRHPLLGIRNQGDAQLLMLDTPGLQVQPQRALDRRMNRTVLGTLAEVDVIAFVVDKQHWTTADEFVLERLPKNPERVLCLINKIDEMSDRTQLLPIIDRFAQMQRFAEIIPVSALRLTQLERVVESIAQRLPEGDWLFAADQITDRDERFLVGEIIREKVLRQLGQELPHVSTVTIESYREEGRLTRIHAIIYVERDGQKAIVIGEHGARLRDIGTDARKDIEALLDRKVMLDLWVKVRSGWSDDERALRSFGYRD